MNQYFLSAILSIIFTFNSIAQDTCVYTPLVLMDIEPVWTHLLIDTSVIGYVHPDDRFGQQMKDGMDHISFHLKTIIEEDHFYSISEIHIDADIGSYLIEKIDIHTGALIWQRSIDIRDMPDREYPLHYDIDNDNLILKGSRCILPDSLMSFFQFTSGRSRGVYYRRTIDTSTGNTISFYSPESESEDVALLYFANGSFYNFFYTDRTEHFEHDTNIFRGAFLVRTTSNTEGIVTNIDTVVTGRYNDRDWEEINFIKGAKITKDNQGFYYYLQQYLPNEDSEDDFGSTLDKYDSEFNLIKSLDIRSIEVGEIQNMFIIQMTDNRILLSGCRDSSPFGCDRFYILLDKELNHIQTIDGNNLPFVNMPIKILANDKLIFRGSTNNDLGHSTYIFYLSTPEGEVELIKEMTIEETEWYGFIQDYHILDNGDMLILFNHKCIIDGSQKSIHNEWFRIRASDIDLKTDIAEIENTVIDIKMSPNPFSDRSEITFTTTRSEDVLIEITDLSGRMIQSESHRTVVGDNTYILKLDQPAGMYICTIKSGMTNGSIRFIRE